jgi:hypothetical protein
MHDILLMNVSHAARNLIRDPHPTPEIHIFPRAGFVQEDIKAALTTEL